MWSAELTSSPYKSIPFEFVFLLFSAAPSDRPLISLSISSSSSSPWILTASKSTLFALWNWGSRIDIRDNSAYDYNWTMTLKRNKNKQAVCKKKENDDHIIMYTTCMSSSQVNFIYLNTTTCDMIKRTSWSLTIGKRITRVGILSTVF